LRTEIVRLKAGFERAGARWESGISAEREWVREPLAERKPVGRAGDVTVIRTEDIAEEGCVRKE
jgi:hypothetical protein